jgi:2-keto-3-deoxy-L-rhamnonate aldolase RhmA
VIGSHRVRERLTAGQPVFGLILNFESPWLVDMLAVSGFDFILIDAEHGPLVPGTAEGMIRAAEAGGMSAIVRVSGNHSHEIQRYLDIGAVGIQVPHIETAEGAKAGVDALRYPPIGDRGLATITRAANYGATISPAEYMKLANRELAFFATIETALAVENIDAIAAVPGVEGLCIGPGDMSVSMGCEGNRSAPDVVKAIEHTLARARAHKKWVSLPASDENSARQCLQMGANIIQFPANYFVLHYGRRFLAEARKG